MFQSLRFVLLITTFLSLGSVALAQQQVPELPDGAGKELVADACVTCHRTNLITGSTGYTHERWENVIKMMELPDPAASEMTQYLAERTDDRRERFDTD